MSWAERHWKLLFLLMIGGLYGAYRFGAYHAEQAFIEERHRIELQMIEQARVFQERVSQAQTLAAQRMAEIRKQSRNLRKQTDEWARTNKSDCRLDDDGVRLWNAAVAGTADRTQ